MTVRELIAALALALAWPAPASAQTLRMPDMPLHDPWIVADRASRTYYLYTSNEPRMTGVRATGTMVYTSRNLRDWTRPRLVFTLPKDSWATGGAWAPEVHRYRGRYYLFTTVHNEATPRPGLVPGRAAYARGTIVAVADRLTGPFVPLRADRPRPRPS